MIMKNKILLGAMLLCACMISVSVSAQLEVQTSGDVKASKKMEVQQDLKVSGKIAVGTDNTSTVALNVYNLGPATVTSSSTYGILSTVKMRSFPVSPIYAMHAHANALDATSVQYPYPIVGVYGSFSKAAGLATFAAGVVGIAHWRGGIGVYGGINSPITSIPADAKYAGYFKGTTKVDGTLLANVIVLNGDTLSVNNIRDLPLRTTNSLTQLHPVSFSFKPDTVWKYDEKMQREMEGTHYGFIAQEVQKLFPELVYEREDHLSINYIEMIPLLLKEIQQLSAEVDELKRRNK